MKNRAKTINDDENENIAKTVNDDENDDDCDENDNLMFLDELIDSIVNYKKEGYYYHFYGISIDEYWKDDDIFYYPNSTYNITITPKQFLDGTLTIEELEIMEENLICSAECGSLFNFVSIKPKINLEEELNKIRIIMEEYKNEEGDPWELENHNIDDVISPYCYYKIGKYEVFSLQLDCSDVYINM